MSNVHAKYTPTPLSAEQKRQIHHLGDAVDRELDNDRRFFERWPARNYRVRKAYPAERKSAAAGGLQPPTPEAHLFVMVRQFEKGVRVRGFFWALPAFETELSEEAARTFHDEMMRARPQFADIEQRMGEALAKRGPLDPPKMGGCA